MNWVYKKDKFLELLWDSLGHVPQKVIFCNCFKIVVSNYTRQLLVLVFFIFGPSYNNGINRLISEVMYGMFVRLHDRKIEGNA